MGGGERVYTQRHVLQDPGGGGKRTSLPVIRKGVIHLGDRLPVRRGNTVDETELQRLMPNQYRHGAKPRHRLALAVILERFLQHSLHLHRVTPTAKGERYGLLVPCLVRHLLALQLAQLIGQETAYRRIG